MLNLTIAMRRFILLLLVITFLPGSAPAAAQEEQSGARFSAPTGGQAVQGIVSIEIEIDAEDIRALELAFRYTGVGSANWFGIYQTDQSPPETQVILWDTTTISDGTYDLRLSIYLSNGEQIESIVEGVRVRNYSAIETNTPVPTPIPGSTVQPTETPLPTSTSTPFPATATTLPPNPAAVTTNRLLQSLLQGSLFTLLAITLLGLYVFLSHRRYEG